MTSMTDETTITTDYGHEVTLPGPFTGMAAVKAANRNLGRHTFDADTLRFFDSKVGTTLYGGRLFVTSEQFHGSDGYSDVRRYTIRCAMDDGGIETVGAFQAYETNDDAVRAIKAMLKR